MIQSMSTQSICSVHNALSWLLDAKTRHSMQVRSCNLRDLESWGFIDSGERLSHVTGRYFSVIGISVKQVINNLKITWNQPIVLQPEVGLLGVACRFTQSGLEFLVQAKSEPGNINSVQLSPTIQATESIGRIRITRTPFIPIKCSCDGL